jgi:RNA polymerase sigma factor (sigma-70 family)
MMKEELIAKYEPLVKATARRYTGRGAEFEDLVQEGYLALLILNEKCTDKEWLTAFIARRLPGYVRTAAQRLRGLRTKTNLIDFEFLPEIILDPSEEERRTLTEIIYIIKRKLLPGEFIMVREAMDGCTQKDLAGKHNITQQAVCARLKKIRAKLEPVFLDRE